MQVLQDEEDENFEVSETKKKKLLDSLIKNQCIEYGNIIQDEDLQHIFGGKINDFSDEELIFFKLSLRSVIIEKGYFVKIVKGNLKILSRQEMASFNEQKNKKNFESLKHRQRCLNIVDPNLLSLESAKKLEFEIMRNSRLLLDSDNLMKKRCK